jgi:hypothetical protein
VQEKRKTLWTRTVIGKKKGEDFRGIDKLCFGIWRLVALELIIGITS